LYVHIDIFESDGTTPRESYEETINDISDEEMLFPGLRFRHYAKRGMGECTFTLKKQFSTISAIPGDVIKIDVDGTIRYIGYLVDISPNYASEDRHTDKISFVCDGEIKRAELLGYTLQEDDEDGSDKKVSTNANLVYKDLFIGGQFGSKEQSNNVTITSGCNVTFTAGNNVLPTESIDIECDSDSPHSVAIEMIDVATGTIDQTSAEPYIYYVDTTNALYTKQREDNTSPLDTYDIGAYTSGGDFIETSDDLDDLTKGDSDVLGIRNRLIINKTIVTSTTYSTEESNSQTTHGIRPLIIKDDNIALSQTGTWWDGINYKLFEPLETYNIRLKKLTYGLSPVFFTAPDGYIKLTRDSGAATFVNLPLQVVTYTLDSGGFDIEMVIGDERPTISTLRLMRKQVENNIEPDTTPPNMMVLDRKPTAYEKTYTKTQANIYLACYAEDSQSGIDSVKFYYSLLTPPSTWGSYILIGNGAYQSPPDSNSQGYYEYNLTSGYYDLIGTAGLSRGDIVRIKSIATDPAGNTAEDVREFQIDEDPPNIYVSFEPPSTDHKSPSVIEVPSDDGFALKIQLEDQSIDTVKCRYYKVGTPPANYDPITVNKVDDGNEHYYQTADIPTPVKGTYKKVEIIATNKAGKITTSVHYVKGVEIPDQGIPITVIDPDTTADDTTTSVPEFKDEIEFSASYKDRFYTVTAADVKFRIYNAAGSNVKTITNVSSPALSETPANSGTFLCTTDVATLGLSSAVYKVAAELTKHEKYIDDVGAEHDETTSAVEGDKIPFQIVNLTRRGYFTDHDARIVVNEDDINTTTTGIKDRLTVSEKETNDGWSDSGGSYNAKIKFFDDIIDTAPDAGDAGWFGTNDSTAGSPTWYRLSSGDIAGINGNTFTINQDDTVATYTYVVFKNGATNEGAIRFDEATPKISISTDYHLGGSATWQDIATGVSNAINDTYAGDVYELKVNSSDGSLTFTQDPSGTPAVLLTVSSVGQITAYGDVLPNTNNTRDLGSSSNSFKDAHLDGVLFVDDVGNGSSNWRIEWDGTNSIAIPHNFAIGFMDG
jgi:hypothetical protein